MLVQEEDLTALVDGCLDVAVSVRKQAITALTEMMQARPANAQLAVSLHHTSLNTYSSQEGVYRFCDDIYFYSFRRHG
jgi:hypothetical protein